MTRALLMEVGGKVYHYPSISSAAKDADIPLRKVRGLIDKGEAYKSKDGRLWCMDEELDMNNDYDYKTEKKVRRLK